MGQPRVILVPNQLRKSLPLLPEPIGLQVYKWRAVFLGIALWRGRTP